METTLPQNKVLRSIAANGCADLCSSLVESEADILADIHRLSESREDDEPLKFKLTLAITANMDANTVETSVSYSVKHTVKNKHELIEEGTPPLPFEQ